MERGEEEEGGGGIEGEATDKDHYNGREREDGMRLVCRRRAIMVHEKENIKWTKTSPR